MVPGQRYQDSRHLLQNPKVSKNIMGFNNHEQKSTPPYYQDVDNPLGRGGWLVTKKQVKLQVRIPGETKNVHK